MCEWRSTINPDYRCTQPAESGSRFCIFHEPGPKDCEDFARRFAEYVGTALSESSKELDLRGFVFPILLRSCEEGSVEQACLPETVDRNLVLDEAQCQRAVVFTELVVFGSILLRGAVCIEPVSFKKAIVSGALDATGSQLGGSTSFVEARVSGLLDLRNARCGRLAMRNAEFGAGVQLDELECSSGIVLSSSRIGGKLSMRRAQVHKRANLSYLKAGRLEAGHAVLEDDLLLSHCEIETDLDLSDAEIEGRCELRHAEIGARLLLARCNMHGDVDLGSLKCAGNVSLFKGVFAKRVFLDRANITGALIASQAEFFATASLRHLHVEGEAKLDAVKFLGRADWSGASVDDILSLANAEIEGTARFDYCSAGVLLVGHDRPTIAWWARNRQGIRLKNPHAARSFWSFARRTYEAEGDRHRADVAFFFESVWRRRIPLTGTLPRRVLAFLFLYLPDFLLLRMTTAYGTSIARAILSWIGVIFGFTAAYALLPQAISTRAGCVWCLTNWLNALHFSTTTFTTLGLGDINPARMAGKALVSAEAAIGGFLMALTVVLVSRKFMR